MRHYIKHAHTQINKLGANEFVTSCANVNMIADELKKISNKCKNNIPLERINEKITDLKIKYRVKYLTDDLIDQLVNEINSDA